MWRRHTSLLVVLAVGVSPLLASQQPKSKVLSYCPSFTSATLSRENKAPVSAKRNPIKQASAGLMMLNGVVEISSDITTNQIWTAGNIYHITTDISVQALLVIEPGTTVEFAYGTSIAVNNGGTLISCGMPDNPIIYTSDSATPDFGDYYCPVYIEETASHSTKVTYSYIEYAYVGILVINNRLDSPIENNYFHYNSYGIVEIGTALTDIQNNLLYYSDSAAIDVNLASITGQGDASSSILIANNTCDSYQSFGIMVRGVANSDEAGNAVFSNNIVSQSYYYGIALVNGYMYYTLANTGYYNNPPGGNTYDTYTNETNPVIETTLPYVTGTGVMPYFYLNPSSTFVNASDEYIEQTRLIGKTTDINGFPDSNKADLGFHYPNWHYSNAGASTLTADFDNSYTVDFNDLSEFADYWLYDYNDNYNCWSWDFDDSGLIDLADFEVIAEYWLVSFDFVDFADFARYWRKTVDYKFQDTRFDLNGDGFVNFKDYAMFADQWRQTTESTNPPIAVTISGDPSNLTGDVSIGVNGYGITTESVFVLIDGEYIDKIEYFKSDTPIILETDHYRNGVHSIKIVAVDINELVTTSNPLDVNFNNTFYNIIASDYFHPTTDYKILGFYNGAGAFEAKVADYDGQTLWSNSYSGTGINITVPAATFGSEQFCEISISEMSSLTMATAAASGGSGVVKKDVMKKFKQADCPANVEMVIVLPNEDVFKRRLPAILECARACDRQNVPWVSLYYHDVTEDNLRFLYNFSSVKYVYWCGHANSHVGRNEKLGILGVQRTHTECWKYESSGWWDLIDNWHKIGVFSWTGGLPDDWDTRGFSLWSLPMHDQWNKKIVFVDGCLSAKYNDMASAYGVFSLQGQGSLDQIYIGWKIEVLVSTGIMENIVGNTTEGVRMFWERMGYGDSVQKALEYTHNNGGGGMNRALWGLNGIPDFGDAQGDDNLLLWGLGISNLNQIKLER